MMAGRRAGGTNSRLRCRCKDCKKKTKANGRERAELDRRRILDGAEKMSILLGRCASPGVRGVWGAGGEDG